MRTRNHWELIVWSAFGCLFVGSVMMSVKLIPQKTPISVVESSDILGDLRQPSPAPYIVRKHDTSEKAQLYGPDISRMLEDTNASLNRINYYGDLLADETADLTSEGLSSDLELTATLAYLATWYSWRHVDVLHDDDDLHLRKSVVRGLYRLWKHTAEQAYKEDYWINVAVYQKREPVQKIAFALWTGMAICALIIASVGLPTIEVVHPGQEE